MKHMEIIQSAIDETGVDCTVVTDYSGRGMYGATCVGITGYHGDCMQTVAAAIKMARGMLEEYEFDVLVDVIMNFKTDNMGRGEILYWPGIECDDAPDSQE